MNQNDYGYLLYANATHRDTRTWYKKRRPTLHTQPTNQLPCNQSVAKGPDGYPPGNRHIELICKLLAKRIDKQAIEERIRHMGSQKILDEGSMFPYRMEIKRNPHFIQTRPCQLQDIVMWRDVPGRPVFDFTDSLFEFQQSAVPISLGERRTKHSLRLPLTIPGACSAPGVLLS